MEEAIYRCWTKATDRETGVPRHSFNWAVSRRGWFRVFADRVECGDWRIPLSSIRRAVMYQGRALFMPARVLEIQTETKSFQFGFNPWVSVDRRLPFQFERLKVKLGYSPFSIVVRVIALGYLLYVIWRSI